MENKHANKATSKLFQPISGAQKGGDTRARPPSSAKEVHGIESDPASECLRLAWVSPREGNKSFFKLEKTPSQAQRGSPRRERDIRKPERAPSWTGMAFLSLI